MKPNFRLKSLALALSLATASGAALAEGLALFHVGDQESWLISAAGNTRDTGAQTGDFTDLSWYGGVDRLATVLDTQRSSAVNSGYSVLTLNAGDAFLPGPRFNASVANLGTAYLDGGQDYYDAIAMRAMGFDATVFGNHEFDMGADVAARFAEVSGTTYLSSNLNFNATPEFAALANAGTVASSMIKTTTGGARIGVIGLTTPLLPTISSPGLVDLINHDPNASEGANLNATVALVQAEIDRLRNDEGVGTVVLLSHLQNAQNEIQVVVPQLSGVDVVVSGGGHEIMSDADDLLLPSDAPSLTSHPVVVDTADAGKKALLVTASFGNRYLGEVNLEIDDVTQSILRDANGVPIVTDSTMHRITGNPSDGDMVAGNSALNQAVVAPVQGYIADLNSQNIGTSEVKMSAARGAASGVNGQFEAGVRNAETNLGNLMADALRHAGQADISLQNAGGIRADLNIGNVTVGDTFNVAPFTNLVTTARMNSVQIKQMLEQGYSAASPDGNASGRFGHYSGMQVTYDSSRLAGDRVLRVVLEDGTVIIDDGVVVSDVLVKLATIDFLANGGDGYDFAGWGVSFENAVNTVLYQEALLNYITDSVAEGGLGGVISASMYAQTSPFDLQGRQIDVAVAAVPEPETYAMLLAGLGLVGAIARRRRERQAA
jgi:5'-nucleotidase